MGLIDSKLYASGKCFMSLGSTSAPAAGAPALISRGVTGAVRKFKPPSTAGCASAGAAAKVRGGIGGQRSALALCIFAANSHEHARHCRWRAAWRRATSSASSTK